MEKSYKEIVSTKTQRLFKIVHYITIHTETMYLFALNYTNALLMKLKKLSADKNFIIVLAPSGYVNLLLHAQG